MGFCLNPEASRMFVQVHASFSGAFASQACNLAQTRHHQAASAMWAMLRVAKSEAPGVSWSALDQDSTAVKASGAACEANLHGVRATAGAVSVARLQRQLPQHKHHKAPAAAQVCASGSSRLCCMRLRHACCLLSRIVTCCAAALWTRRAVAGMCCA